MEVDQIQCKFAKIRNGGYAASEVGNERERMDDEEEEGEGRRSNSNNGGVGGAADPGGGVANGLYGWPSSRIVRVSKATGGKDRHSKVITSRGLRDRRVRLSVNTAIQFYDLQDRLGYDQPSKAVEWLLTAAAGSIAELPPMNSPFPVVNKPPSEEKMSAERGANQLMVGGGNVAAKSSVGSSSSETSKGSGLSISRSESRVRARERAKERAVEREKDNEGFASFTELLSGGIKCINGSGGGSGGASMCRDHSRLNNENPEQSDFFPNFPMDYFSNGISSSPATTTPLQIAPPLLFAAPASHHHELQPFSFTPDHLVSVVNTASSSATRGTLQSNISSPPPSLHFPPNFFPAANHRHLVPGFDARLQLYDGDDNGKNEGRNSEPKRKDKP